MPALLLPVKTMSYVIRTAETDDIPAVFNLICQLEETKFDYAKFESVYKVNLANEYCVYLVADAGVDDVVGFCSCHIQNLLHHCGKVAEIQELIVAENHRGKGIGNLLVEEMKSRLIKKNCISLEVTAQNKRTETHQFYELLGFKNTHKKFVQELL